MIVNSVSYLLIYYWQNIIYTLYNISSRTRFRQTARGEFKYTDLHYELRNVHIIILTRV